jgi:hypothetical protein
VISRGNDDGDASSPFSAKKKIVFGSYKYICTVFTYVNIYRCTYVHIYICTYIYIHMYVHIYICTYIYTHMYIHIYTYVRIHIYIYTYTYTHIHIHIYICTYIQMYRNNQRLLGLKKLLCFMLTLEHCCHYKYYR